MLTSQEMLEVYKRHETEGRSGQPYVLHYEASEAHLTFFGSVHTADPNSPQWERLEGEWQQFTNQENDHKIVIFEKAGSDIHGLNREQAIIQHGETGLVLWLAKESGIEVMSPQVDRVKAIASLQEQGFTTKEIITYYFARQMHQWVRQDKEIAPDWEQYMKDTIEHYNELQCWGEELTLQKVLSWFTEISGKEFAKDDIQAFYNVSDPSQNPVSAASGKEQDVALKEAISRYIDAGTDVFVVYGSGHAIRLEPVLDDTYKKTTPVLAE